MRARLLLAVAMLALGACAASNAGTQVNATSAVTSPNPWPTPLVSAPNDPPKILALWMNETTIPSGSDWFGRIVTSTNVASVEIRTESFSFVAERSTYGDFQFRQHMLDMVPFYKRRYVLSIIARNAAGATDVREIPIEFR